jgi:hypothetical protein
MIDPAVVHSEWTRLELIPVGAKRKKPTVLELPPFPTLTWDGNAWAGRVVLKSWERIQTRLGAYGSDSSDQASDGTVWLSVSPAAPPPSATSRKRPPSSAQGEAYRQLLEQEHVIRDRVVRAIVEAYNGFVHFYIEAGVTDLPPRLDGPEQLRELMRLSSVHVLAEEKEGVPYVGFQFGCEWDQEHGLGVMTHQGQVVQVGAADASFCPPWPETADGWPPE